MIVEKRGDFFGQPFVKTIQQLKTSHFVCENCGAEDHFFEDFENGDVGCYACGCLSRDYLVAVEGEYCAPGSGNVEESYARGLTVLNDLSSPLDLRERPRGAPYARRTYFTERIRQWRCQEPWISEQDWDFLWREIVFLNQDPERKIRLHATRSYRGIRDVCKPRNKKEVSELLRLVSKRYREKYLERWRQIRKRLTGIPGGGEAIDDDYAELMLDLFLMIEKAFKAIIKHRSKRSSMLSYDGCIRRINDWLGIPELNLEFPPLKDRTKYVNFCGYMHKICVYLQLPYINSDAKIFGIRGVSRDQALRSIETPERDGKRPLTANDASQIRHAQLRHGRLRKRSHLHGPCQAPSGEADFNALMSSVFGARWDDCGNGGG